MPENKPKNKPDRNNPSKDYRELLAWAKKYQQTDKTFTGRRVLHSYAGVKLLVDAVGAKTVLDYGCGKGQQYALRDFEIEGLGVVPSLEEGLGVKITPYDPAWPAYAKRPVGVFDGVVCNDVLSYIPDADLDWVIAELFAYAAKFVFVRVGENVSRKGPTCGRTAHSAGDWALRMQAASAARMAAGATLEWGLHVKRSDKRLTRFCGKGDVATGGFVIGGKE